MSEMSTTREAIVAEARTWVGTPFRHQARVKALGVDCVGLIVGVCRALGLVAPGFDVRAYPRLPDGHTLIAECDKHLRAIARDEMRAGDAIVARFDSGPQHFGIVAAYRHGGLAIIHAASSRGRVIETRLQFGAAPRSMKFVAAYALPGVA